MVDLHRDLETLEEAWAEEQTEAWELVEIKRVEKGEWEVLQQGQAVTAFAQTASIDFPTNRDDRVTRVNVQNAEAGWLGGDEMPWVDKSKCAGCGICVGQCPVNAIFMEDGKAEIDMEKCIRCGKCHDACPQEAVRHDSERIPQEVEENLEKTRKLMENFKTEVERKAFLERMERHFNKEKKVAEKSIEKIRELMGGNV